MAHDFVMGHSSWIQRTPLDTALFLRKSEIGLIDLIVSGPVPSS